jgi:hypothetical protein
MLIDQMFSAAKNSTIAHCLLLVHTDSIFLHCIILNCNPDIFSARTMKLHIKVQEKSKHMDRV